MKTKAFFEKISKQGKITNEDFAKALETLPAEHEIPDVFVNLFDENFLTRERALADPKVYDTVRGEVLDGVKLNIKEYLPFLAQEDQETIGKEPKAFNQLKMLKDAFGRSIEKIKAENPSNDEKVKELQKAIQESAKQITAVKTDYENKQADMVKKFDSEKSGMKLDWSLDKKLSEFTFADEYKDVRPHLTKGVIDKIKSENVLILGEDGQIQVHEKMESGATKPKFRNGSEAVTLDNLLEEPLKPFLKKNNGAGSGANGQQQNGQNGQQGRQNQNFAPKDPSKMTLKELQRSQMQ